jgi:hypothetical protein
MQFKRRAQRMRDGPIKNERFEMIFIPVKTIIWLENA